MTPRREASSSRADPCVPVRALGIVLGHHRIPNGVSKSLLVRTVERGRDVFKLRKALALIGLSSSRFHASKRAEKARELYEANNDLLRVRLDDVVGREKEHVSRAADLDDRDKQLARRALELEAMQAQVHELRDQRQSLNATIASLTARAGRDFAGITLGDEPEPEAGGGNGNGSSSADA